jgi:cytochrome c-type biogenesis protein
VSVAEHAQQVVTAGNLLLAMPVAATAGFVSFASPCVLPLVPGYLSYVSGVSGQDLEHGGRQVGRVLGGVALFVVGYSLVFVALGATLGALTAWLFAHHQVITRVADVAAGDRPVGRPAQPAPSLGRIREPAVVKALS